MKLNLRGSNNNNNNEKKDIVIEDGNYEVEVIDIYINREKYIVGSNFMIDENGNEVTELNIGVRYMISEKVNQKYQRVSKFDNFKFDVKMIWKIEQYAYALGFEKDSELDAKDFIEKLLGSKLNFDIERYTFNNQELNRVSKVNKSNLGNTENKVNDNNIDEEAEREVEDNVVDEELNIDNETLINDLLLD